MDAFPDCFCKSVVGKMISTGGGPNHPTCVVPRYQSTGRRQSFYFRPIRNNRRSPGVEGGFFETYKRYFISF